MTSVKKIYISKSVKNRNCYLQKILSYFLVFDQESIKKVIKSYARRNVYDFAVETSIIHD